MSAVSKRVIPRSSALCTTARVPSTSSRAPKLLQPSPMTETRSPDFPRLRCSMSDAFWRRGGGLIYRPRRGVAICAQEMTGGCNGRTARRQEGAGDGGGTRDRPCRGAVLCRGGRGGDRHRHQRGGARGGEVGSKGESRDA